MAKRGIGVDVQEAVDPDTQREAEDFAALNQASGGDLFAAVDELRTAGAGDVVFIVNRISPVESKGYCGKIPISKFDLEYMKTLYGAGRYMVQIKGPKGFLAGGGPVEIAPTPEIPKTAGGDFAHYLEMQDRKDAERRARNDDWIKLVIAGAAPILAAWVSRSPNQGTDIAGLVTALKPAPGPTLTDLSTMMVNMKGLTAAPPQESRIDEILKIVETVQGMSEGKEDGKPGASSWIDIVRDLIKVAPDALKPVLEARMLAMQAARQGGVQRVSPQIVRPPQAAPTPPIQPTSTNGNDMLQMFMPVIKMNLVKIAGWAEKNRDPQIYADVLVDELPDNFGSYIPLPQVLEYLNHPQWFEEICKIEPRLQTHRGWCDECRLWVIEIMKAFETEVAPIAQSNDNQASGEIVNTAEN